MSRRAAALVAVRSEPVVMGDLSRYLSALFSLTKPGISLFIGLTAATAVVLRAEIADVWFTRLALFLSAYLFSSGSAVFNQYYEVDLDMRMERTRNRAIPSGIVSGRVALLFSVCLLGAGGAVTLLIGELFALIYLSAGAIVYIVLYTMLTKRRTAANVVVGGFCGFFAALAGGAAADGGITAGALAFAAVLYFWSAPHFWSLALVKAEDYRRAGVPMLPITHGGRVTAFLILAHTLLLPPLAYWFWPELPIVAGTVLATGLVFTAFALRLLFSILNDAGPGPGAASLRLARRTFFYSLAYLPLVFLAFAAEWLSG